MKYFYPVAEGHKRDSTSLARLFHLHFIAAMQNRFFYFLIMALCLSGCEREDRIKSDADAIAFLQCQAKHLQDEGYALQERITTIEDSLALLEPQGTSKTPLTKLPPEWEEKKKSIIDRRAFQARVLTGFLDSVWKDVYKNEPQKKALDSAIKASFEKNCLLKKG